MRKKNYCRGEERRGERLGEDDQGSRRVEAKEKEE
jgi:hypothetical protein